MTPEDKIRIHKDIFTLCYNSNGGFTHDEVYSMPAALRSYYLRLLVDQKKKEIEEINKDKNSGISPKSPSKKVIQKPF